MSTENPVENPMAEKLAGWNRTAKEYTKVQKEFRGPSWLRWLEISMHIVTGRKVGGLTLEQSARYRDYP